MKPKSPFDHLSLHEANELPVPLWQFPRPAPQPASPITSNPTLAGGRDNVIVDPKLGFGRVVSYSLDGTGNNLQRPAQGAAGTDEVRLAPANFAVGSTPVDGPNARVISNVIMANDPGAIDPGGRSAFWSPN